MRIVFAGTPAFADTALKALISAQWDVVAVFTQPDRPAGRGMKLNASPVKQTALAHGIPVHQPRSLKLDGKYPEDAQSAQAALHLAKADAMVVAAYGLILPVWALEAAGKACVNIHASLLPRWRGAAPIHRAIAAQDAESGVCLMAMEEGLDTGGVYARYQTAITPSTTGGTLHDTLASQGANLLLEHLTQIVDGHLPAVPQSALGVSYAQKILKAECALDFSKPAAELAAQIRAFDPAPGCHFTVGGDQIKVWAAIAALAPPSSPASYAAGTILSISAQGLMIACGQGCLIVTEVQKAGGKRVSVQACWSALLPY